MHRSKVTEACYIDCSTSATEEEKNVDEIGRYATWIYARKMDDGCLFMSRRMDEEYRKNGNITSFVHIEKVFDLVPREFMEWKK